MKQGRRYDINLWQPVGQAEKRWRMASYYMGMAFLMLAICLAVTAGLWLWQEQGQKQRIKTLEAELKGASTITELEPRVKELQQSITQKEASIKKIEDLLVIETGMLADIEAVIPKKGQLTEMSIIEDQLVLKGLMPGYDDLSCLIQGLSSLPWLTDLRCSLAEKVKGQVRFELVVRIKGGAKS